MRIEEEPRAGMALRFASELERARMKPLANFIMRQHHDTH